MKFKHFCEKISSLSDFENELDAIFKGDFKITRHFVDRIRERHINPEEIVATLKKFIDRYSDSLASNKKKEVAGVVQDLITNLNIPVNWDNRGTPSPKDDVVHLITVMKKKGFVPNNPNDKVFKIKEGINDPNLFKAVIVAGGPGSGKSFIVDKTFGGTGARIVNSDEFTEHLLQKNNLPMVFQRSDTDVGQKQTEIRYKAKELATNKALNFFNGMLPVIIDGTGAKYDKIMDQKKALEEFGYDVSMLFVNTPLEVALDRNQKRKRTVDPELVKQMWEAVQNNLGKFQQAFGKNFAIVDNDKILTDKKDIHDLNLRLGKISRQFIEKPLQNYIGRKIINTLQRKKGKLVSDLGDINIKDFKV